MKTPRTHATALAGLAIAAAALASLGAVAQDTPGSRLKLTGTYEVSHAVPSSDGTVNLDFAATIWNSGTDEVDGRVLLRHMNDAGKVWAQFGDATIAAGGQTRVSANVTIPSSVYDSWSSGGVPPLFVYAQNDRGDVTRFRVPLSKMVVAKASE